MTVWSLSSATSPCCWPLTPTALTRAATECRPGRESTASPRVPMLAASSKASAMASLQACRQGVDGE